MKSLKISVVERFFNTYFIPKFEYFLCSQLQFRMKSANYVLTFKCSQNVRSHTPVFVRLLVTDMKSISKIRYRLNQRLIVMLLWIWITYCFHDIQFWKAWQSVMKTVFQYSQYFMNGNRILHIFMDSFILCLTTVIVACSLFSNVCAGPELETPYEQATIRFVRQNMNESSREDLEKERVHSIQFFGRLPFSIFLCKIWQQMWVNDFVKCTDNNETKWSWQKFQ